MIELSYYGGYELQEGDEILEVSLATVLFQHFIECLTPPVVLHVATGGMGSVYEAVGIGRRVAVKVARTSVKTVSWLEQLSRETEILARLCHPKIVPLLDRGTGIE